MGGKAQIWLIIAIGVALAVRRLSSVHRRRRSHTGGLWPRPHPRGNSGLHQDDKPIADANVVINSPGFFETTYRTDKNGVFTAMVPCHTKEAKSLTHEVTVSHDKYKASQGHLCH